MLFLQAFHRIHGKRETTLAGGIVLLAGGIMLFDKISQQAFDTVVKKIGLQVMGYLPYLVQAFRHPSKYLGDKLVVFPGIQVQVFQGHFKA